MIVDLAEKQLHTIFECGRKVGIEHAMFIAFGTLLGYTRENGIIEHDGDTDVGIRSDWITREQEIAFYWALNEAGCFRYRRKKATRWYDKYTSRVEKNKDSTLRGRPLDGFLLKGVKENHEEGRVHNINFGTENDRLLWLSLMSDYPGTKNCLWFFFPWKGFLWHCKGGRWLSKIGRKPELQNKLPCDFHHPDKYESIMKGNTLDYFDKLLPKRFIGGTFNVPFRYGSLCDEWYPDWATPRIGGASARHTIVLVEKWNDENTWRFIDEGTRKPRR